MTFRQWLDQFGCAEWIATEVCVPKVLYEDNQFMYLQKLRNFKDFNWNGRILPGFPKWPIWVEVDVDPTKFKGRNTKALKIDKKVYYGCVDIYQHNQPLQNTEWNFERS